RAANGAPRRLTAGCASLRSDDRPLGAAGFHCEVCYHTPVVPEPRGEREETPRLCGAASRSLSCAPWQKPPHPTGRITFCSPASQRRAILSPRSSTMPDEREISAGDSDTPDDARPAGRRDGHDAGMPPQAAPANGAPATDE